MVTPAQMVRFARDDGATPRLLLAGVRRVAGAQSRIERSPSFHLVHYVCSGRGWVMSGDGPELPVAAGDWFCCPAGGRIRYRQDPEATWRYRWLGFTGDGLARCLAASGLEETVRTGRPDAMVERLHDAVLQALGRSGPASMLDAQVAFLRLLTHLARTNPSRPGRRAVHAAESPLDVAAQACQFMIGHFSEGIGAAEVAHRLGYERSYLSRLFARDTGGTLQGYLARLRLERAKELLRRADLGVSEVGAAVGMPDPKVFGRFFARHTGRAPRIWRRFSAASR